VDIIEAVELKPIIPVILHKMTATLTFARFFRRFGHPIPHQYASPVPYDCLLERYNLLQAGGTNNTAPLLCMFPNRVHPLPNLIQRLDATLLVAFRRPYTHILYSAADNLQNHQSLDFTLVRQWIHQNPKQKPTLSVVTFLEPASLPTEEPWLSYWTKIHGTQSTPPPHFWTTPPLMLSQDARGIIQYPGPALK
jgi:hypothetical protein